LPRAAFEKGQYLSAFSWLALVTTPVPIAGNIQPSAEERLLRVVQAYFYCFADGSCLEVLFPDLAQIGDHLRFLRFISESATGEIR
jgi:hypothetical protein